MNVRKSDNSVEEFSVDKVKRGVCEAYGSVGETCPEALIDSLSKNLYIYENIQTSEIRRQVEECLMSINKKVAKAYIAKNEERDADGKILKNKNDFITNYINASNASTGSKFDPNANVTNKNIATLNAEIPKQGNIQFNRYNTSNKIAKLYSKKLAQQYIKDLNSHIIYKNDESSFGINSPYTYSAKEVIEVKYNSRHLLLPFDLLWDVVDEDEVLVNESECVFQKYPQELFVKDFGNKFTKVTVITKKKRFRDLVRVKTAFGEDVIVTDNHPMIVDISDVNNTVEAINSLGQIQYKINDVLEFDGIREIDLSHSPDIQEYTQEYCISYNKNVFKRTLQIDEEFGYFVGFFVGDGHYNIGKSNGSICFTQKDRNTLIYLNNILFKKLGIVGTIRYKRDKTNCFILSINSDVLWWILSTVFQIKDKAQNKTLPYNILEYNEEFAKGILAGLIDSDGTINDCQLCIRLASRSGIVQATALLRHFNYGVGNIIQNLPFSNNENHFNTNYTLWGVNASVRNDSTKLPLSNKLSRVRICESGLKYAKDGEVNITKVSVIQKEDSFLECNDFIYDITTDTRTFACNNLLVHNCVAIQSYPFLVDGLKGLGGLSAAPKNLDSFCGMFVNLVFAVSSQFAGAVAIAGTFNMFDYYARKEWGDDYYLNDDKPARIKYGKDKEEPISISKQIEQYFQQIVYSINQPAAARGFQSA